MPKNTKQIEKIKEALAGDIKTLRDPGRGYIKAGLPRFGALFGRDSCIASWELLDYDDTLAKDTIKILSDLQGKEKNSRREEEPGKIVHEWHPRPAGYKSLRWPLPYYGSVDSTPLFIFLCGIYYEKTTDTEWLGARWPNIEAALSWCEKYGDMDGDLLLEYERKNPAGLMHQGWKDSTQNHLDFTPPIELVEAQGYYYAALSSASELALALKKTDLARKLSRRAKELQNNFLKEFWLAEQNFFATALSESKIPDTKITSNPGHLLFTGILDDEPEKRQAIVKRLFQSDMWTPYGIRTHSEKNPDFNPWGYHLGSIWPHDNWIIAQGLKRYGLTEEYEKIKQALIKAYKKLGKIPELYAVEGGKLKEISIACWPQAWSSGALLNFLAKQN